MIHHMAHTYPAERSGTDGAHDGPEALHQLREQLKRYELIFQATNDVLYDLDLQDGTVDWNDALYTQYGYSRTNADNTLEWWVGHVHPDDALLLESKVSDIFKSSINSWQCEYRFRRADDSYGYVRDRALLLRDAGGNPQRIIGSLLDITAQKQLDTAKDEFISLVSHQLRTPLTVIRVYGEMLTGGTFGSLSAEQARWVRNITNSSARLIDVVGTILNVSRIDLGRVAINATLQDAAGLIRRCIKEVMPLADEKEVCIRFEAPMPLAPILLDETVFIQIVHNLLTNAIRYTEPKRGRIVFALEERAEGYVLKVHDNGIGVPQEAQEHIFERFYRAKNALGMEAQGSGLGLYLVKVMCDSFGGKVWFDTAPGKGSTFYVQIPKWGMIATAASGV